MRAAGFTLIEVVMTIALVGILAVGVTSFVGGAIGGYVSTADRSRMATSMVIASERISRDIRRALPNSIRIGGALDNCVEFIPVVRGGYYLAVPVSAASTTLTVAALGNASPVQGHVAVYPTDVARVYDLSTLPSVLTPAVATVPPGAGEVTVSLGAAHRFPADSPYRRFYVTGSPRAYCQPVGSTRIYLYRGYGFNATATLPPVGGSRDVLIDEVDAGAPLAFDYLAGSLQRNAILRFTLAARVNSEAMTLDQEVQVKNVP